MGELDREQLQAMKLPQLVDRLEDLEGRRTPVGWSPEDAVERAAVERRIMEIVGGRPGEDERRRTPRLPCELAVRVRTKRDEHAGEIKDVGLGGVFVATDATLPSGTHVYLEARDEHGLRARGMVAYRSEEPRGLGISFYDQPSDAHERRFRRFVLSLLAQRSHQEHD